VHRRIGESRPADVPKELREEPHGVLPRLRLEALLGRLDEALDEPIAIGAPPHGGGRIVWVFGCVGYWIDERRRAVVPVRLIGRRPIPLPCTVELWRPLSTPVWLTYLLRHLGLSDWGLQRHLFRGESAIEREEKWIAEAAYARLERDARFCDLRERRLPAALALDPELCRIALGTRPAGAGGLVCSARYTRLWRLQAPLKRVLRENPRLLALAVAALEDREIAPREDLVQVLHERLRAGGVSGAGWRYLARRGTRIFLPLWRHTRGRRLEAARQYLVALQGAGLPPPPREDAARIWLRGRPGWAETPGAVLAGFLAEAASLRGTLQALFWEEDARLVLGWASAARPALDKRQRRAGWRWLLRAARAWERRQILLEAEGPRAWASPLEALEGEGLRARVIGSLEELVEEGGAFHNCLATLYESCQDGTSRYFVLRSAAGGKRVAVAELRWRGEREGWALGQVRGPANSEPGADVHEFAACLERAYRERAKGAPPPEPAWIADIEEAYTIPDHLLSRPQPPAPRLIP